MTEGDNACTELPVLPSGDRVVFPHTIEGIRIEDPDTATAVAKLPEPKRVAVLMRERAGTPGGAGCVQGPDRDAYHPVGTLATVIGVVEPTLGMEGRIALVKGLQRIGVRGLAPRRMYLEARVRPLEDFVVFVRDDAHARLAHRVRDRFEEILHASRSLPCDFAHGIDGAGDGVLSDMAASWLAAIPNAERRKLLGTLDVRQRLHILMPWLERAEGRPRAYGRGRSAPVDPERAAAILDEDHYGVPHVKERVLEHVSVHGRNHGRRGPTLCLVGPPGVGKTSMARSIARATGRRFAWLPLGGVRDETDIRGSRRSEVGALPGRILRGLQHAGSRNPVFVLDEVDKIGADAASALAEAIDPEQGRTFRDRCLDVVIDLADVMFVATANTLDPVPAVLRKRMDAVEIPGYVHEDKVAIARRHLVPRQLREHGLDERGLRFRDDGLDALVDGYTREAGVRNLERAVGAVCRKRVRAQGRGETRPVDVGRAEVTRWLGPPVYVPGADLAERARVPGVAVAAAWTGSGGDLLFIEVARTARGSGRLTITGQVRSVMQESARAALSWLRTHAAEQNLAPASLYRHDLHLHIPQGGVAKDGPSAGVAMAVAMMSLLERRAVRPRVAFSGELTLTGLVLPVGGIHEKVLAARRDGVRELVLPKRNEAQVRHEIPPPKHAGLQLRFVGHVTEALDLAFENGTRFGDARPVSRVSIR